MPERPILTSTLLPKPYLTGSVGAGRRQSMPRTVPRCHVPQTHSHALSHNWSEGTTGGLSGTRKPSAHPSAVGSSTCHRTRMSHECGAAWAGTAWLLLSDASNFVTTVTGLASEAQSTETDGHGQPTCSFPESWITSPRIRLTFRLRIPEFWTPGTKRQGRSQPGPEGSAGGCLQRGRDTTQPHGNHRKRNARATVLSLPAEDGARYFRAKLLPDWNSGCSFSNCGQCNLGLTRMREL